MSELERCPIVERVRAGMRNARAKGKSSNAGSNSVENNSEYVPAGIVSVAYPQYPINAVISGAVVIQVTVDKGGKIERLKTIRDLNPFTQFALSAARKWQFQAATLHGKPKISNAAIAFVFTPPLVTQ